MPEQNKFFTFLETVVAPIAGKVGAQRHVGAIRDAFVTAIPFIIVGSFLLVIAFPPFSEGATNIWATFAREYRDEILHPFNFTMGMMTLWVVTGLGYNLAKSYSNTIKSPLLSGVLSLSTFLMISAPVTDGKLEMSYLGGAGIFTALLVGIFIPELMNFLKKNNISFKLPAQVPEKVRESFDLFIPILIVIVTIYPLNLFILNQTGFIIPQAIMELFKPLVSASDTLPALLLISFIAQVLWWAGVHGSLITGGIIAPFVLANLTANQEALANGVEGTQLPTIFAQPLLDFFMMAGGSGATFALVLLLIRSRAAHLRAIGKMAFIPGIFNINEPVSFGTPIVMNPVYFIPWILIPQLCGIFTWCMFELELLHRIIAIPPWTAPTPLGAAWATNWSVMAIVTVAVNYVIAMVIWYPFMKMHEKQLLEEEAKMEAKMKAQAVLQPVQA